ncbi:integrase domain-containing protein [Photobacterium damselae subsp. damselae]|uniref:integrase domain-containing protein n=1 Tax=Photobacterium damselae TaxID=38293 RepID=UPI00311B1145
MATNATRLNQKQITSAKPKEKDYVLSDGGGLQLRVRANGSRLWNFNYHHPVTKKRVNMGLGPFPEITLANARKLALEARELVAQGVDPKEQRNHQRALEKQASEHTLLSISQEWFKIKQVSITEGYAEDVWRSLERHVFPVIGHCIISTITAPQVIELLRPIEARGSLETVKRLSQRLNEIFSFAVNSGVVSSNPLRGIRAVFRKPQKENMVALRPEELPELMRTVAQAPIRRMTRCLIEWQLHTMTRPSEAAGTRWDEIDVDAKVWVIPAHRMKKRREHRIPLTEAMLGILTVAKSLSARSEYVFPAERNLMAPYNSQTVNMALKRMGFRSRLVSHGMRSLASTALNEQGFNRDWIEAALAHVDTNQVRSAYNRTDYLEQRREMMQWWSSFILASAVGSLSIAGT